MSHMHSVLLSGKWLLHCSYKFMSICLPLIKKKINSGEQRKLFELLFSIISSRWFGFPSMSCATFIFCHTVFWRHEQALHVSTHIHHHPYTLRVLYEPTSLSNIHRVVFHPQTPTNIPLFIIAFFYLVCSPTGSLKLSPPPVPGITRK